MLHELLVALSGHSSPHYDGRSSNGPGGCHGENSQLQRFVSRSEQDLLQSLSHLGHVHADTETRCKMISSSHVSLICRAVASFLIIGPLSNFSDHLVQVEKGLLSEDPDTVGAYDAVPLSGVVRTFSGWRRQMQWLQKLTSMLEGGDNHGPRDSDVISSGAQLIAFLRTEAHTGFSVVEKLALQTLQIAESTWIRQTSSWLLYGVLPSVGQEDFFISLQSTSVSKVDELDLTISSALLPIFVEKSVAQSIVAVGKLIRRVGHGAAGLSTSDEIDLQEIKALVVSEHAELLVATQYPIQSFQLKQTISTIHNNLSDKVLQKLLPTMEIMRVLDVLREFMLLERGDFTTAFIEAADKYINNRYMASITSRETGRLGGMLIRESELSTILAQAWSTLAASQDRDEDFDDEVLEVARRVVRYSVVKDSEKSTNVLLQRPNPVNRTNSVFSDVMLATPASLSLHITTPHDLFITHDDASVYSSINSYLLSIRRTTLHISHLWRLRTLRMFQDMPWPTNESNSRTLQNKRKAKHVVKSRVIWTVVSEAHFFFNQLGFYLQGEVVRGCTNTFHEWLGARYGFATIADSYQPIAVHSSIFNEKAEKLPHSACSESRSEYPMPDGIHRPATEHGRSNHQQQEHLDLQVVIAAHKKHISHLYSALLLDDTLFITSLRSLITRVEHLIALFSRLETVIRATQVNDSRSWVAHSLTNYTQERLDIVASMDSAERSVRSGMRDALTRLAAIDEEHGKGKGIYQLSGSDFQASHISTHKNAMPYDFAPWRGANLSHLLVRLEILARK